MIRLPHESNIPVYQPVNFARSGSGAVTERSRVWRLGHVDVFFGLIDGGSGGVTQGKFLKLDMLVNSATLSIHKSARTMQVKHLKL